MESTCTHKMQPTCKITKDLFVYVYHRKGYSRGSSLFLHVLQSVLHVVQVGWGYLLMLVAMSFNGWLFLSVCFGAGVGFFLFARLRHHSLSAQDKNEHCHWSTLRPVTCLADPVSGVVGCILHSLLFFYILKICICIHICMFVSGLKLNWRNKIRVKLFDASTRKVTSCLVCRIHCILERRLLNQIWQVCNS